jgi:transcriptional regulator with XRE-family HTH domain
MSNINSSTYGAYEIYTERMADEHEYQYLGFGGAVRYHRRRLRISQDELAQRLGVTQSAVAQWEQRREPFNDPWKLGELAQALQTTADDLREGRVRVGGRSRTMDDYIDEVAAVEAPPGVDQERLRELLQVAADLPPDALRALVEWAEWQRSRQPKTPERKRRAAGDSGGDSGASVED